MKEPSPSWHDATTLFRHLWLKGPEEFRTFARQMHDYLYNMTPGRSETFRRYEGERLEWCIAAAAAFLVEGEHWREYQLMDDKLTIHRLRRPVNVKDYDEEEKEDGGEEAHPNT